MSDAAIIVDQFAHTLGAGVTSLATRGHTMLDFGNGRRVGIEPTASHLLVHVSQARQYDAPRYFLQALKHAHHTQGTTWPVQVALQDHHGEPRVLVLMRLDLAALNASRLEQAVAYLSSWLDSLDEE